jgi:phosphatidylglycerol:prolipoprotein diacylglycerol transferase
VYPTLSDLLHDLFGLQVPLPIQTFGFFVALSFLAAAYTLSLELRRKEKDGLLQPVMRQVWQGQGATPSQYAVSVLLGFIIGYKVVYFMLNYQALVEDPQGSLLSLTGSWWGGIAFAAASAGMRYMESEKEKKKKRELLNVQVHPADLVSNLTMVAAVSGILGAKLFHNLEYPDVFFRDPWGELMSFSGLTMYGGLIAGAIAVIGYGRKHGLPALQLSDAAAPGLMLAYGVGRIGCHLAGDGDWGIVNTASRPGWLGFLPDWTWSYTYPHNVVNEGIPIPGCQGHHCFVLQEGVFPTPLYESITCILLFFLLWSLRRRWNAPGMIFSAYLLLNGVERFFIEKIRVNARYHLAGLSFTQAELISLILVILGLAGLYFFRRKKAVTA